MVIWHYILFNIVLGKNKEIKRFVFLEIRWKYTWFSSFPHWIINSCHIRDGDHGPTSKEATRLKVTQKATESAVLNISLRDKTNLRDRQAWRRRTSRSGWAIAEEEEEEKNKIFIYLTYPFTFMGVFMDSLPHIIHLISSPVIPFFLRALIVTLPTLWKIICYITDFLYHSPIIFNFLNTLTYLSKTILERNK